MRQSLKDYKTELFDKILTFLWEQWSALGVSGYSEGRFDWIIDPEPLLLFSFSICRFDSRLFDEIIDWLFKNGQFINIQRLSSLQKKYGFASGPQVSAAAEYLSKNSVYRLKWKRLSNLYALEDVENLFYARSGQKIPVSNDTDPIFLKKGLLRNRLVTRGYSREFPVNGIASFLLQMRAFFGINARSELICLLSTMPEIHPAEAARLTGYFQKTVQTSLLEMSRSGIVEIRKAGREKYYRLKNGIFDSLIPDNGHWRHWTPFFKGFEIIREGLAGIDKSDNLLILSSELRRIMKDAEKYFNEKGTGVFITDGANFSGQEYIPVFFRDVDAVLRMIEKYSFI